MGFKKIRSVSLPEETQGMIYYTCRTYHRQTKRVRRRIETLCGEVAGEHAPALMAVLTTRESIRSIALRFFLSESALYELRRRFYERWGEK